MIVTLLICLGVAVVAYVVFMLAVPSAAPEDPEANLKSALNRLYDENRANEHSQANVMREQLGEESAGLRAVFKLPLMESLYEAALQAGFQNNLQQIITLMAVSFAGGLLGGIALKLNVIVSLALALVLGYFVPYKYCQKKVANRNRKFIDQFPDALDIIVRSVRSGFPLTTALQMLSQNAEDPVREEFRKVNDDIALGRPLSQALARLAGRINEPDIRFFVVVLSVQQETGGNLSEIVSNLSNVIRKRKQLRNKIKAMTSEGKATGYVLGGLPVVVFVLLYFLQPGYLEPFFNDSLGQTLFGATIALLTVCFFTVRAMINIDI